MKRTLAAIGVLLIAAGCASDTNTELATTTMPPVVESEVAVDEPTLYYSVLQISLVDGYRKTSETECTVSSDVKLILEPGNNPMEFPEEGEATNSACRFAVEGETTQNVNVRLEVYVNGELKKEVPVVKVFDTYKEGRTPSEIFQVATGEQADLYSHKDK